MKDLSYLPTDSITVKLQKMNRRYIRKPECKEILDEAVSTIENLTTARRPFNDRLAKQVIAEQVRTIDRLTAKLQEREKAIRDYLDGNYERPVGVAYRADGVRSKHDMCVHHISMWDVCESCINKHFEEALE